MHIKGIITADCHLRTDKPRCRLDSDEDWIGMQKKTVQFIIDEMIARGTELYIIGDIFHRSVTAIELLIWLINIFELSKAHNDDESINIMPGQHDLPYHSWDNVNRSSYGVLREMFPEICHSYWKPSILAAPFGMEKDKKFYTENPEIVFTHQLVFPTEKDRPIENAGKTAKELLQEYPTAKWIFTGDYHKAFHFEEDGRHVVNPGCITRQAADFKDYKPSIYYVDTEKEEIIQIPLPDIEDVVTDKHIQEAEEREDRIASFIEIIQKQGKITLNFIENLKMKLESANLSEDQRAILLEIIEEITV